MSALIEPWDYLVVTASNAAQAKAYETQLQLRQQLGFLSDAREVLVVADPGGQRVGSGGSTIYCLISVLNREAAKRGADISTPEARESVFRKLRILIIHAGGDSKRVPAYGPCGKIFVPVPGESDSILCTTLFDRQIPRYFALPSGGLDQGQIVIASGDVLLGFDPSLVRFDVPGITGLGCYATQEQASKHGVYMAHSGGEVRRFLQKPSPHDQRKHGVVDRYDRSILDIGVMSFDAVTASALLNLCETGRTKDGSLAWSDSMGEAIARHGIDFYGEICCALGGESSVKHYLHNAKIYQSKWPERDLQRFFAVLSPIPFHVQVLPHCSFLHFGAAHQLISSGRELVREDRSIARERECLSICNAFSDAGRIHGKDAWVEGCEIEAELRLTGDNVLVGVNVNEPFTMPSHACLDVIKGFNRNNETVWFFRYYKTSDDFKGTAEHGGSICGVPVMDFLHLARTWPEDVWDESVEESQRGVWNSKLFPAESNPMAYRRWAWMMDPEKAAASEWDLWRMADRYSFAEMAERTHQEAFHERRARIRAEEVLHALPRMLRPDSSFSAPELAYGMMQSGKAAPWVAAIVREARRHHVKEGTEADLSSLNASRILHTLGSALLRVADQAPQLVHDVWADAAAERAWLADIGLDPTAFPDIADWATRARAYAFEYLNSTILSSGTRMEACPKNALRKDEIVWGRAPARLDLGGGWSDTPPYALERGGCVINAAVDLNGTAPIQAYARVIEQPVIRLASIDFGERIEIKELEQLVNYRRTWSQFSLPKAALAISGFSLDTAPWPQNTTLKKMLEHFGGGIELTTLAAIPGGSGLGTSSIVGAVVLAVVQRLMGRMLTQRELFHGVLRLEQAMTTGGGWQDQVGGAVRQVKVSTAQPGLVPDPMIHFVPSTVLDQRENGGCTLLYYTGITRLAKNILQNVVGRYLDRERAAMATLERIHAFPRRVADAMARQDAATFGRALDAAWELKKRIDPGSTNEQIEALLKRMRPYIHGAKLMGAGGGGFLLLVCKSPADAQALRHEIENNPPNDRARFFDFNLSDTGLVVTVC